MTVNVEVERARAMVRQALRDLRTAQRQTRSDDQVGMRALERLTRKERDLTACIADAMSNQEISALLAISEQTVKKHLNTIYDKLGVNTRLQLCVYVHNHPALRAGLTLPREVMRER